MKRISVPASVLGVLLTVSSLAGATATAQAAGFPSNPVRLATDNINYLDAMLAMGYEPKCATGLTDASTPQLLALEKQDPGLTLVADSDGGSFDYEELAACHPDGIVLNPFNAGTSIVTNSQMIAPTLVPETPASPANHFIPRNAAGQIVSDWKAYLMDMANAMGSLAPGRAETVIANLDRRAAALRGLVSGVLYALIQIESPSTFAIGDDWLPSDQTIREDLGMHNFDLPDSVTGCDTSGPPADCEPTLSSELLNNLDPIDVLLVSDFDPTGQYAGTYTPFLNNPLFTGLPAVKAGRVTQGYFQQSGPINITSIYDAVESALKISEYSAFVAGGKASGAKLSLTFEPSTRKSCWGLSSTPGGARPKVALELALGAKTVRLTGGPSFATTEAPDSGWNTTPATYQAAGCAKLSTAEARMLASSPTSVEVEYAGGTGPLQSGPADIRYSTVPKIAYGPTSQTARVGARVTFKAGATALTLPSIMWEVSSDKGRQWSVLAGATTGSHTTAKVSRRENGLEFRAVFETGAGETFTKPATLRVKAK